MAILKTCLKAGHRWGVGMPVPYADWYDGWMELSQCQRLACRRFRLEYGTQGARLSTGRVVTYDATESGAPKDLKVVRN